MTHDSMSGAEHDDANSGRDLGEVARDTAEAARERFGDAIDPLRDKMRKLADQQKDTGAEQMEHLAHALDGAAHDLEHDLPMAADYVHQAAHRLEEVSARLRRQNIDDLMHAAGDFARQRPGAFFGGAVLAGFALARFLKSPPPSHARRY